MNKLLIVPKAWMQARRVEVEPEPRFVRINAVYLGLLCVLVGWNFLTLRDPEQQAVRMMGWTKRAACFIQPLLLWFLLGLILERLLARAHRVGRGIAFVLINGVAIGAIIDGRCKHLFLEPLSWDMLRETLREADVLFSALPVFLGKTFWLMAVASLALMNLAMIPARWRVVARWFAYLPTQYHQRRRSIVCACLLAAVASCVPPQPSHLEEAVFIGAAFAPLRRFKHSDSMIGTELASACEQKAAAVPGLTHSSRHPLGGLARGKNLMLFIGESWGYSHTSLADPAHDNTPVLRRLAQVGAIATVARVQSSASTKAMYGVLSGRYASPSIEIVESQHDRLDSLARILSHQGYDTVFASTQRLSWQNIRGQFTSMGFARVLGENDLTRVARRHGREPLTSSFGVDDAELLQEQILPPVGKKPFFVTYYNTNTHVPYFVTGGRRPHERQVDYYHRALRFSDSILGKIIEQLEARHQLNDTVIVVVGDHGENFSEDGEFSVRECPLKEPELLVPLVIAIPGLSPDAKKQFEESRVIGARQIDIAPTLLHLMGMETSVPMQGRSLLESHPPPVAYINSYGSCQLAGVVDGSTKYMFDFTTESAWRVRLDRSRADEYPESLEGALKTQLGNRLKACAQYNDSELRRGLN